MMLTTLISPEASAIRADKSTSFTTGGPELQSGIMRPVSRRRQHQQGC
jgi:hypothetical protein